jgi:hypothetical protein
MVSPVLVCNDSGTSNPEFHSVPCCLLSDKGEPHHLMRNNSLHLVGWVISGDQYKRWNYLKVLSVIYRGKAQYYLTI